MPFWKKKSKDKQRQNDSPARVQDHIVPVPAPPGTQPVEPTSSNVSPPPILNPPVASSAVPPPSAQPGEPFRSHGHQLAEKKDYNGAVVMYNSALQLAPQDAELLLSRSVAHMMSTPPRFDLALKDADEMIRLHPTNAQGWMQKGDLLRRMNESQSAVEGVANSAQPQAREASANSQPQLHALTPQPLSGSYLPPPPSVITSPAPPSPAPSPTLPVLTPSPPILTNPGASSPAVEQPSVALPSSAPPSPLPPRASTPAPVTEQSPLRASEDPSRRTSALQSPTPNRTTNPSRDAQSVSRSPLPTSNTIPQSLFEDLPLPEGLPPAYTENFRDPVVLNRKLDELERVLSIKNKGSLLVQPYTLPGQIDAVRLLYDGLTTNQLTARETATDNHLHPNFANMTLNMYSYPGSTFIDFDCETLTVYEGKAPGTVRTAGYSEEYRLQQLRIAPLLHLTLEADKVLPEISLNKIVQRLRKLQVSPTLEDNDGLYEFLGLAQITALQNGFYSGGSRQKQIDFICMSLNRSQYDAPSRFVDMIKAPCVSSYFIGSLSTGKGLRDFLYQILLGCELLVRLRKEPVTTSYQGIMTDSTSALIVLGALWMSFVTFNGPRDLNNIDSPSSYTFLSRASKSQAEALIRFAEALDWPYLDEARNTIETAYNDLVARRIPWNGDMWDWLFNLVLPGKIYRHKIMACLVYASPTLRSLNAAPFYDNGLVVSGRSSYWPQRSVLGRVLGGCRNVKSVCGWIGPLPAPSSGDNSTTSRWIRLSAREVTLPVPVRATPGTSAVSELGFDEAGGTDDNASIIESLLNPDEWVTIAPPVSIQSSHRGAAELMAIKLTQLPVEPATAAALAGLPPEQHRASVEFKVNGAIVAYTLYTNPVFVYAQPCVGEHVIHKRTGERYFLNVVTVENLKSANPIPSELFVIDAMGPGEDAVARAWCAERGRCAIVRKGNECCIACTVTLATARKGLGFNVIIMTRS